MSSQVRARQPRAVSPNPLSSSSSSSSAPPPPQSQSTGQSLYAQAQSQTQQAKRPLLPPNPDYAASFAGAGPELDADARKEAVSKGLLPRARGGAGGFGGGGLGAGGLRAGYGGASARPGTYFPPGGLFLTTGEWRLLFVLVIVASAVRLFRISKPDSVVFDEVHFGKFASKYIKTQYFVDVHPPLAKLLITLSAFIFGYDGHFDFKDIAKPYESTVPYVAMRMVPALLGILTIPLSYLTIRALDCRATTALLTAIFLTFENGLITQSRHILLDSPLVFFTALTTFNWVAFCNEDNFQPFTETWWAFLTLTGLSLGAVLSCKWVGLFTVATVGLSTVVQLWNLLGDTRVKPRIWIRHFVARAICLIGIPMMFYMGMFWVHFGILQSSGEGDGFMSSEFQHTLSGKGMRDTFADVSIGSKVTIRHLNTQGGYLHSHPHNYPTGSKQQQITLYPHRDANNNWGVFNATQTIPIDGTTVPAPTGPVYLEPGMRIKLRHLGTEKHLHSHDLRAPVSDVDFQNEVSAYGMPGFAGDANDDWIVEIEIPDTLSRSYIPPSWLTPWKWGPLTPFASRDNEATRRIKTLRTVFRLRHALTGCYLFSHKVKLPEWGFEQQEVTCNKNAVRANSLWVVESSEGGGVPDTAEKVNYVPPSFFAKFWELQKVMWTTNAGLTDRHSFDSRPESWFWLRRGINFWVKDHRHIYLLGNPLVWWLSSIAIAIYVAARGLLILRAKRGYRDFDNSKLVKYDSIASFLLLGWSMHYFPFFLMARQLFLHHYFPALYFAVLLATTVFDFLTSTLRPRVRLIIAGILALGTIWHFSHFSAIVYGGTWTKQGCKNAKWVKSWDFSCNDYLDDLKGYDTLSVATPHKPVAGGATVAKVPKVGNAVPDKLIVDQNAAIKNLGAKKNAAGEAKAGEAGTTSSVLAQKLEPGVDIFDKPQGTSSVGEPLVAKGEGKADIPEGKGEEKVGEEEKPTTKMMDEPTREGTGKNKENVATTKREENKEEEKIEEKKVEEKTVEKKVEEKKVEEKVEKKVDEKKVDELKKKAAPTVETQEEIEGPGDKAKKDSAAEGEKVVPTVETQEEVEGKGGLDEMD